MGSKTCTHILRTIRQLQPCSSVVGMTFPKFSRNYKLESTLPLLSYACNLKSTVSSATVLIRCLSHDTSPCVDANNRTSDFPDESKSDPSASVHVNHADLLEDISLKLGNRNSRHVSSIITALNKCTTPMEVLEVFSVPSYRRDELFLGVQKLGDTFMALTAKQKCAIRDFIIEHQNLHHLTHGVLKVAPVFTPGALVHMLNVFVCLKLNDHKNLIKTLLLRCQEDMSSLSKREIVVLANTLELLKSDKDVDMVKSGVRLLLAVKIEAVTEVQPLLAMMRALGKNAPLKTKFKFEDKALQMFGKFNVAQSENLFNILADIGFFSQRLLDACSEKFIEDIDELSYTKIVNILASCRDLEYFNQRLLTVIGDQILKAICLLDSWKVSAIVHYFAVLNFRHAPLLDRYAAIFMNKLNSVKVWDVRETVQTYSRLNHLPKNNEQQFLEALKKSVEARLNSIQPKKLLYTVLGLCALGVCPEIAINKLLEYKHIFDEKENTILEHINLCLMIEQSPSNRQSLLHMKKITTSTCLDIEMFYNEMKAFINNPDLYHHCVHIANTYYIDFILALDTQEKKLVPVGDMQADNLQMDDLSKNIVRIAVLCCTPNAFAMGTLYPLGGLALKIRNLKSLGFSVVLVPINRMMSMSKEKRVELMEKIILEELSDDPKALEERWAKEDLQQTPFDT